MARKARALYDFEAEVGSGEISLREGDIITITNTEVGEGWFEGTNANGETGFFPEAYVEICEADDTVPTLRPPHPQSHERIDSWVDNDWKSAGGNISAHKPPEINLPVDADDWESDFEGDDNDITFRPKDESTSISGSQSGLSARKSPSTSPKLSRFSVFPKSGMENFLLGGADAKVDEADMIQVGENGDGTYTWVNSKEAYSCSVGSPKKEAKLKGLKTFIAYQLTPSFSNEQVSRRYKHFDWLHERLTEKFTLIPIPPLPDKNVQQRYEDDFISRRMHQLQNFVTRMCNHPVLSQSEVWQHFITCTEEKQWKAGKRKAEKDPLVGASFFLAIKPPENPIDSTIMENEVKTFTRFNISLTSAVRNMYKTTADQTIEYQTHFKREFKTIGKAFTQLGNAMEEKDTGVKSNLTNAIILTGETYMEIAQLTEEQGKNDWDPLGDTMHDYVGILAGWPGILHAYKGAIGKNKEVDRMLGEGKVSPSEATNVGHRADVLSCALLAEIFNFHNERIKDMQDAHKHFLKEQISYYQKITEKLQDALRKFDDC